MPKCASSMWLMQAFICTHTIDGRAQRLSTFCRKFSLVIKSTGYMSTHIYTCAHMHTLHTQPYTRTRLDSPDHGCEAPYTLHGTLRARASLGHVAPPPPSPSPPAASGSAAPARSAGGVRPARLRLSVPESMGTAQAVESCADGTPEIWMCQGRRMGRRLRHRRRCGSVLRGATGQLFRRRAWADRARPRSDAGVASATPFDLRPRL
eukprot:350657-Chlamydomonas_euryale.AAC.3